MKSTSSNLSCHKVWCKNKNCDKNLVKKTKMPKFSTKNALFGYFWLEFENNIVIFEINTPNLSKCKISRKNKMPKFGFKNTWFAYFGDGIWKYYCHNWNLCPWISLVAKFRAKIKILKFGTKNAWFWYFWDGIWK